MNDERAWSRQLRRDRRAAASALEENSSMPGPGAAAAPKPLSGSGGGVRGRFGSFLRGSALSGLLATGVREPELSEDDQDGGDTADDTDDGAEMQTAGENGPSSKGRGVGRLARTAGAAAGMVSPQIRALQTAQNAKGLAAKAVLGANADSDSVAKFSRFTLPLITVWRFLLGEVLTPIADFGMLHLYAAASVFGFGSYAPKKLTTWEWLILIVLDSAIFSALIIIAIFAFTAVQIQLCALNPLCVIQLIRSAL